MRLHLALAADPIAVVAEVFFFAIKLGGAEAEVEIEAGFNEHGEAGADAEAVDVIEAYAVGAEATCGVIEEVGFHLFVHAEVDVVVGDCHAVVVFRVGGCCG